jgi:hypothetical protein
MAGNRNTPKSLAPKSAQEKTGGRYGGGNANVSKQTTPGSKGVFVGKNAGKGVVQSTAQKMKYGGTKRK